MTDERLLAFSRAFADSARSGLPPAATLRELAPAFGRWLVAAAESVDSGKTLHESLGAQNKFPPVLIALIRAGEESGKIDSFLDRYSASLDTRIDFRRRLERAFVYPAFGALLAGGIFLLFSTKAAPLLLEPLIAAGVSVPPAALRTMKTGEFLLANWPLLLGALIAAVTVLRALAGSPWGRAARALAGHWLPGARYASEQARFYDLEATLELLLGAGLRPNQVMDILGQYFHDDPLTRRRLARGAAMMAQGKGFAESLAPVLPADDRPRVIVAEQSGLLDETFGKLAKGHRDLHLHRLKQAATLVQLGAVVALAPVCFALILWILGPTMAVLRDAGKQLTGLGAAAAPASDFPALAAPNAPVTRESAAASRFNESHGAKVLGFMREHGAAPAKAEEPASASEDGAKPAKKKWTPPKLKSGRSMQRAQFDKIESTPVRSRLE